MIISELIFSWYNFIFKQTIVVYFDGQQKKRSFYRGKNFPGMYPSVTFKRTDLKFEIFEEVVIVKFPAQNRYKKIPEKKQ